MNDDYLWDRSGPPDREVERLEKLLRPLAQGRARARAEGTTVPRAPRQRSRRLAGLAVAASLVLAAVASLVWSVRPSPHEAAWTVDRLAGSPLVGERPIAGRAVLRVGGVVETDATSRARIQVGNIGLVDVDPETRLEFRSSGESQHRLRLLRGTLHATIVAPPGEFVVETPSSTAIDLGCAYTLSVDEKGAGEVYVTSGWVGFEWRGRESFIPAGAMCRTRPGVGPGTPYVADTPEELQSALETLDFGAPDVTTRRQALDVVLSAASAGDAITLWHLLARLPDRDERARVYDRLNALVPAPGGVTREGVLGGERTMLDRWWSALSLGDITLWRRWTQRWSDPGAAR